MLRAQRLLAGLTTALALLAASLAQAATTAFVDVTVIPMDREARLPHQTVVVRDGVIVALGPKATTPPPAGATVIEGAGRYLLPGLADMHAHFLRPPTPGLDEHLVFPDYLERNEVTGLLSIANGVTTVRNLWGHPATDRLAARFAAGETPGPTIYSSGPITDGDPPIWKGARVVLTPAEGRAAVRQDKADGRVGVKVYDGLKPEVYAAIMDEARRQGLPVFGHVPVDVPLAEVIAQRQASIEHAESLLVDLQPDPAASKTKSLIALYRDAQVEKLKPFLPALKAAGVWICPTVVVGQMDWRPPHQPVPEMVYYPADFVARYAAPWDPAKYPDGEVELRYGIAVVRLLHEGGVPLIAGTDMFKMNVVPGFALLQELGYYVQAGLTPFEALQTATYNPAKFLGREGEFGSVALGRRADLILLNADPLADLTNLARREGVMVRGRWYAEAQLQARLARVRAEAAKPAPSGTAPAAANP